MNKSYRKSQGMSLFSMMILMGMASMSFYYVGSKGSNGEPSILTQIFEGSQIPGAKIEIIEISKAIESYMADMGNYPSTKDGLAALIRKPASVKSYWGGPYLLTSNIPTDPWGYEYIYENPGKYHAYDLYSIGNKESGDSDDAVIANWDIK